MQGGGPNLATDPTKAIASSNAGDAPKVFNGVANCSQWDGTPDAPSNPLSRAMSLDILATLQDRSSLLSTGRARIGRDSWILE